MALQHMFLTGKPPVVSILSPFLCILSFVIVIVIIPFLSILTIAIVIIGQPILWLAHFCRPTARAWLSTPQPPDPLPDRGLDERILHSLPRVSYNAAVDARLTECAICLMELVDGDVMRVLPYCGHGFHLNCVDGWLKCHSSCPYCRGIVVMEERCPNEVDFELMDSGFGALLRGRESYTEM